MTATLGAISVSIPKELVDEVDQLAAIEGRSRDALIEDAVRFWVRDRRWKAIQAEVAPRARAAGLLTEDDIEDYIDELSE